MSQQDDDIEWMQPEGNIDPFDTLLDRLHNIRDLLEEERNRLKEKAREKTKHEESGNE